MKLKSVIVLTVIALAFWRCDSEITGDLNANLPPETTIFVKGDSLNTTQSVQTFYWDGRDPDGFITGFYYTLELNPTADDWTFTSERSGTFALRITGADTSYVLQVKAVDNLNLEDPTPASQEFPIANTRPQVAWSPNSRIPDTTLTVASFAWSAADPDGDETIEFIEYALDDTSNWIQLPGDARSVDLKAADGLTEGEHVLWLRAVDIAGARSQEIRMPEEVVNTWYVKLPRGSYLLIDDYAVESAASGRPDAYYRGLLNNLLPTIGEDYTYWNIEAQFPASPRQFTETLKLFDRIIWYTDIIQNSDPHFIYAQSAIPEFRQNGGKIIYAVQFNSAFGTQGEPLAFAPVDTLGTRYNFIATNQNFYPDPAFATEFPTLQPLPDLKVSTFILGGAFALKASPGAVPMYRYDDPAITTDPLFVILGRNDNTGDFDFVFSGTPLHFLQGNGNLDELFEIILKDVF